MTDSDEGSKAASPANVRPLRSARTTPSRTETKNIDLLQAEDSIAIPEETLRRHDSSHVPAAVTRAMKTSSLRFKEAAQAIKRRSSLPLHRKSQSLPRGEEETTVEKRTSANTQSESDGAITSGVLYLWLRRCRRKFQKGVPVISIDPSGRLMRRTLLIGAQPEYIELASSRNFEASYHVSDIVDIKTGSSSPAFNALRGKDLARLPRAEKSLVIELQDGLWSLVFRTAEDRRDAQFLVRVERRVILERFTSIQKLCEDRSLEAGVSLTLANLIVAQPLQKHTFADWHHEDLQETPAVVVIDE